MGAFGTGLYANDDAMDVRDTLRNMLNADYTLEDNVAQIVGDFGLNDVDEASVDGLLALADCLCSCEWRKAISPASASAGKNRQCTRRIEHISLPL